MTKAEFSIAKAIEIVASGLKTKVKKGAITKGDRTESIIIREEREKGTSVVGSTFYIDNQPLSASQDVIRLGTERTGLNWHSSTPISRKTKIEDDQINLRNLNHPYDEGDVPAMVAIFHDDGLQTELIFDHNSKLVKSSGAIDLSLWSPGRRIVGVGGGQRFVEIPSLPKIAERIAKGEPFGNIVDPTEIENR